MATLTIVDVKCVKKQDTVGQDSIHVHVDGKHLAGPFSMGKTDVATPPNATYNFTGSANIELIEVDGSVGGSNDENLGSFTVKDRPTGRDPVPADFNRLSGAAYILRYKVTA